MAFPLQRIHRQTPETETEAPPVRHRPCKSVTVAVAALIAGCGSTLMGLSACIEPREGEAASQTALLATGLAGVGIGTIAWLAFHRRGPGAAHPALADTSPHR